MGWFVSIHEIRLPKSNICNIESSGVQHKQDEGQNSKRVRM